MIIKEPKFTQTLTHTNTQTHTHKSQIFLKINFVIYTNGIHVILKIQTCDVEKCFVGASIKQRNVFMMFTQSCLHKVFRSASIELH